MNNKNSKVIPYDSLELLKPEFWKEKTCPDEIIGLIEIKKNGVVMKFHQREDYDEIFVELESHDKYFETIPLVGKIAIILESPHVDEFFEVKIAIFGKEETNARPANGKTGSLINEYLHEVFKEPLSKLEPGKYSVSLINSIQQQCSLGQDTLIFRDKVWACCWFSENKNYKNNFLGRIDQLNPNIILNCSTVGKHYKFNDDITNYIAKNPINFTAKFINNEYNQKIKVFKGGISFLILKELRNNKKIDNNKIFNSSHPSSWFSKKNRILKSDGYYGNFF